VDNTVQSALLHHAEQSSQFWLAARVPETDRPEGRTRASRTPSAPMRLSPKRRATTADKEARDAQWCEGHFALHASIWFSHLSRCYVAALGFPDHDLGLLSSSEGHHWYASCCCEKGTNRLATRDFPARKRKTTPGQCDPVLPPYTRT